MSKYIIDIPDNVKKIVYFHVGNANAVWTTSNDLDDLELLTADYINEHYGSLQDDAYQRGLEDGKWKSEDGCTGCKYEGKTGEHLPCEYCMNNFKNQWTAKSPIDDGFVRGDVVVDERDGTRGIVVSSENNESNLLYVLFKGYRVPQSVVRKHYKKTGEHYDIDKFLDEIKGDGDK